MMTTTAGACDLARRLAEEEGGSGGEDDVGVQKAKDSFFQVPVCVESDDVDVVEMNKANGVSVKEIRKYKLPLPPYEDFFQFFS